jgi:hypothetical protein
MAYLLETLPEYRSRKKIYVFANTGREMPATIMFIKRWMEYLETPINLLETQTYLHQRKSSGFKLVTEWMDLSMDGEPFEQMVEKYGLPSIAFPHCTRELKINPIKNFIKEHLGLKKGEYEEAIGYRFDELHRAAAFRKGYVFPLIEQRVTKEIVKDFWLNGDMVKWDLALEDFEGNCDFCFKKSWGKLEKMRDKHPNRLLFWNNLEEKYWKENNAMYRGHAMAIDLMRGIKREDKDISCACSHNEDSEF